jgi:putative NADPH-quinone reductase
MADSARVLLIEGHPDGSAQRLNRALADAYAAGAEAGGHTVHRVRLADLDIPVLRSAEDWTKGELDAGLKAVQAELLWAQHVVLCFPLWLGDMPALVKAFLEQVARPGFAVPQDRQSLFAHKPLSGRSARVIVTMGMPAVVYRWYFRAHSVKSLERNVLGFVGFAPVRETLIGGVDNLGDKGVARWCQKLQQLGRAAA